MGYSGFYLKAFKKHSRLNYYPLWWLTGSVLLTIVVFLIKDIGLLEKSIFSLILLISISFLFLKNRKVFIK
jgi:hypothetical protein